jgi:hypothetical protein
LSEVEKTVLAEVASAGWGRDAGAAYGFWMGGEFNGSTEYGRDLFNAYSNLVLKNKGITVNNIESYKDTKGMGLEE